MKMRIRKQENIETQVPFSEVGQDEDFTTSDGDSYSREEDEGWDYSAQYDNRFVPKDMNERVTVERQAFTYETELPKELFKLFPEAMWTEGNDGTVGMRPLTHSWIMIYMSHEDRYSVFGKTPDQIVTVYCSKDELPSTCLKIHRFLASFDEDE
jgi:hypothetical protein